MSESPITRERWHRVEEILDEALELPPDEVPAFLDRACAGDAELRAAVENLLAADRQAAGLGFLGSSAEETAGALLMEDEETLAAGGPLTPALEDRAIGPYQILRRLGAGGMGIVYLARDRRLERTVALKLLPPEWGGSAASRERFLREARIISALDHPNICTLHDIGETEDGRLYLVMSYYGGETLKAKLERGPLPVDEAVELAVQIGSGLARAHEAGIIHRDIKPANVIVTEHGEAKILDFGIAKLAGEAGLTRTGSSLGTPAYMSPEQAKGRAVDARTDIWSLGVLLYEMITGRRPFAAEHPQAQIHAILQEEPEPVSQVRPGIPPAVARAVGKAMTKDPDRRYQSVNDFIAELSACTGPQALAAAAHRRHWRALLAAGVAAAVLLGLAGWWIFRVRPAERAAGPTPAPAAAVAAAVPVVGVLPFANRTGDAALDWYGEGVARLARDSLSSSRHLQIVSELRVEPLADLGDQGERVRRAADDGITALLSGEILPGPQGLTLAARVVETRSGRQLAARRLDGLAPKDLLQASDEIALEARKALNVPLTESVDLFAADFAAENPEAYEAYIAGLREFVGKRYDEAERGFAEALHKAPGFTMARFRLAHTLAVTGRTDKALAEIRQAVSEADRLPDRDARLVRALAAYISRDYDDALTAYAEITRLYPYEVEARYFQALLLKSSLRYDEALAQIAILTRLEPENPNFWDLSGGTHLLRGNLHQAVQDYLRLLRLTPESADAHMMLGDAYRAQGELTLAAGSYTEALRLDPQEHSAVVALAIIEFLRGQGATAERRLARLVANAGASPRARLDAAFELASLLRAQGRFRRAAATLAAMEDLLAAEKIREALALSVRGLSLLEVGDRAAARPLLERAVERSPGVPTRYLFTRGLLELEERRFADLDKTISEILAGASPAASSNRKEEKAAACLRGMRELEEGRPVAAVEEFARAVTLQGFEYTSSKLWLARAYLAAGRLPEALAAAHEAEQREKSADPRLDLEVDRTRALLVQAQVHAAMGHPGQASALASQFLERWKGADPDLPDLAVARRLAAG